MKSSLPIAAAMLLLCVSVQAAPVAFKDLPRGAAVPSVECLSSPGQTYALYLPTAYTPTRSWPILYGFDAGGRGMVPVRLFREAAERHGIIVVGSNNFTSRRRRSIEGMKALDALYRDTNARFALDPKRVYAAGYSGGARVSWTLEFNTPDLPLAGIIAVGAGLPDAEFPDEWDGKNLSFFGIAGDWEWNYYPMVELDQVLEERQVAHRFATFPGGHEWAPKGLCTLALDWMQVQAMRRNLVQRDESFLQGFLQGELKRAQGLEETRAQLAHRIYSELSRDLTGLIDTTEIDTKRKALEASGEPAGSLEREKKARKQAEMLREQALGALDSINRPNPPQLEALLVEMGAESLLKSAQNADKEVSLAASRALETVFSRAAFRMPRQLRRSGELGKVPTCLRIAIHLKPDSPLAWYGLAQAEAQAGDVKESLDALQRSIALGLVDGELISGDPLLQAVQGEPRFREILQRLGVSPTR